MSKAISEVLGDCDGNGTLKMFVEKAPAQELPPA